jgi:Raf kinase inhibitor-like YbhB/YbcL family protein
MHGLKASCAKALAILSICFSILALGLSLAASSAVFPHDVAQPAGGHAMAFALSSKSFPSGGDIPKKFTCDGADISPELSWQDLPANTQAFALIADDPDAPAGTWTHWVLYDLPSDVKTLPEGTSKQEELPNGARQGRNDFRKIGYNGPCPPPGKPHRYYFKLHALDSKLNLKAGASRQEVERAMQSHILGKAEWMGRYKR